ncbi:MAG: energy transducer TonB [Prevotellaceae bacterium]|jgi:TonB family protein|nr:energy transducer TonB [Prevotellaceae bacterium]
MKKIILISGMLAVAIFCFSELGTGRYYCREQINPNEPLMVAEEMPLFNGVMRDFITQNIKYPTSAKQDLVQGTVVVSFVVEKDASISNYEIINSVREDLDNEALRVAKLFTFKKSAFQNGKPVRVKMNVPIRFKL